MNSSTYNGILARISEYHNSEIWEEQMLENLRE